MTPEKALDEFSEYCAEVAGDWSDFDGRTLRDEWSKCESVIRPAMVARLRRLEAAEKRAGEWYRKWEEVLCEYNALRKRLEAAEKHRRVLAKALTALYRHEDATADALAELAGFETWEDVYAAALAGEKRPCPCGREGSLDHEDFCEEAP